MENLDPQFKKLRDSVKLSAEEKEFHKNEILRFVATHEPKPKAVLSPFSFQFFPKAKLVVVGFAFFLFFSTGLVSSAKSALPNQYLYVFKIKVIEPVQIFLAWDREDRNNTRVALITERLEDFSKVSLEHNLTPEDKAVFADSFSLQVKEVQQEITKLAEEEQVSAALSTANDLQSVLTAHTVVLDKIRENETQKSEKVIELKTIMTPDDLVQNINEGIGTTNEIIGNLTIKLQSTEESEKLAGALTKQKGELNNSVAKIELKLKDLTKEKKGGKKYVEEKLGEINALIKEGDETTQQGNKKETVNLYNEADQKLGELKTLLGSSEKLGLDLFGESEVEGEIELMNTIVPAQGSGE